MQIERIAISPTYSISKVIKGGWHLAGGHGQIQEAAAIKDMLAFVEAGITTFDCADIYTGVEILIGQFLKKHQDAFRSGNLPPIQIHTKYVPDYQALATLTKADTEKIIDRSLQRLGVERLDLVQFAWWDYKVPRYVETALHLSDLQQKGKIRYIGVTNFDGKRLKEILDAGVKVTTNQVQYSVLDRRVEKDFQTLNPAIPFLCYGVVAGGFLSNRYWQQAAPPKPLENRSLVKYDLIIEEFGGYDLFQALLDILATIGAKHKVLIAEVAMQYILQKANVAGIIIGARNQHHLKKLQQLSSFKLDATDLEAIAQLLEKAQGPNGPFYELERDKEGKHGRIMKYNLNEED
jgi:aryl-alcohol dehydrogenase-like predicted oxidoreductase